MASTTHGYPYPIGTDRVMDGDDAIHALADKVENNLLGGVLSGMATTPAPPAVNTGVSVTVTFPVGRFTAVPFVVAQCVASSPHTVACTTLNATASGVTLNGSRLSGSLSAINIAWMAQQV